MKNTFIAIICLLCTLSIAQHTPNKISPYTSMMLADMEHYAAGTHHQIKPSYHLKQYDGQWYANAFIILRSADDLAILSSYHARINTCVGKYITAQLPVEEIKHLALCEQVEYIEIGEPVKPLLDSARYKTNADLVLSSYTIPQAYNGKDVIVGIIDIGFDYTHPQFLDPTGSYLRIKRVWNQDDNHGTHPAGFYYGGELTDSLAMYRELYSHNDQSHGSHVAGIAAGGGYRDSTPYKGMAPMSDIVMVATDLTTTGIYDGICYISRYAQSVGKPCVINMSLGTQVGPHDGCSTFDTYCSALLHDSIPQGLILVGSAGNDGSDSLHLKVNTASTIRTFLDFGYAGSKGSGSIDIWGDTNAQYSVVLGIYNTLTNTIIDSTIAINPRIETEYNLALADNDASAPDSLKVSIYTEIFPLNNKPRMYLYINNSRQDDTVNLAYLQITTYNNATVHAWSNDGTFTHHYKSGFVCGNTDYTCGECGGSGKSMISVGAYTSRRSWTSLGKSGYYYPSATHNDIAPFSSHGPTADERHKPDVAAPGQTLASSVNSYHSSYDATSPYTIASVIRNNRTYYYAVMQGTSMAAPSMTGIMALWLQAYPQLSVTQAKAVIQATSIKDAFYTHADIWGAGKVDALAGIQYILSHIPPKVQFRDTTICQGDTLLLAAPAGYKHYLWSTGDTTRYLHISTAGSYAVKLTSTDDFTGPWSDTITVSIELLPDTPHITRSGLTLYSSSNIGNQWYKNGNALSGVTGTIYMVNQPGIYGLTVKNAHGCISSMDTIVIDSSEFFPSKPSITPGGNIFICEGDTVILSATAGHTRYTWSNGLTTQQIIVTDSGYYTVKVFNSMNYGSVWSDSVHVGYYGTPATPVITKNGVTLSSSASTGNQWYKNDVPINGATDTIYQINTPGTYGLTVSNTYGCTSDMATIVIDSAEFMPPKPTISPAGNTYICKGNTVMLTAPSGYSAYTWNTGQTSRQIVARDSGYYAVKVTNSMGVTSIWSDSAHISYYATPATPVITAQKNVLTSSAADGNQWYYNSNIIAGATSPQYTADSIGDYGVMVTSTEGCPSAMASITLDSTAFIPDMPEISPMGDTYICPYDYVTLSAPEGYMAYLWSTGDTTRQITVNDIGAYKVKVMNSYHYYSPWSNDTRIYHYALPNTPVITRQGLTLSSNADTGNQWYYEHNIISGATLQNYTVSQSGWYQLTVNNEYGCVSDSAETYVDIYDGIGTADYNEHITLYPNPSQGDITIVCPFNTGNAEVEVYDITGRYISTPAPIKSENYIQLHLHNLSAGVYMIKLLTGQGSYSLRMVISK